MTKQEYLTGVFLQKAGKDAPKCTFPCAVRPDDTDDFSSVADKIQVFSHHRAIKGFMEPLRLQHYFVCGGRWHLLKRHLIEVRRPQAKRMHFCRWEALHFFP